MCNMISDINALEFVNFQRLKELDLGMNYITDIKVFERVNFPDLFRLDLRKNRISKKMNLQVIKQLKLYILNFLC